MNISIRDFKMFMNLIFQTFSIIIKWFRSNQDTFKQQVTSQCLDGATQHQFSTTNFLSSEAEILKIKTTFTILIPKMKNGHLLIAEAAPYPEEDTPVLSLEGSCLSLEALMGSSTMTGTASMCILLQFPKLRAFTPWNCQSWSTSKAIQISLSLWGRKEKLCSQASLYFSIVGLGIRSLGSSFSRSKMRMDLWCFRMFVRRHSWDF